MNNRWRQWYSRRTFYAVYDLPTGWEAMVVDHSQDCAPQQPTKYNISASSTRLHISWCAIFANLEDAKRESLKLALTLPPAPVDDEEATRQFNRYSPMSGSTHEQELRGQLTR